MVMLYPPARLVASSDTKRSSESAGLCSDPGARGEMVLEGRVWTAPPPRGVKTTAMEAPMSSTPSFLTGTDRS